MCKRALAFIVLSILATPRANAKTPMVLWKTLALRDSKKPGDRLRISELAKADHRIPGFMLPIEAGDSRTVKEFLFMPSLPACIHVPPPPPNQQIYVKVKAGKTVNMSWHPVWLEGRILSKATTNHVFGDAYYEMEATGVEPIKEGDLNEYNQLSQR